MLTPEQKKAKREAFFKKEQEEFNKKIQQHIKPTGINPHVQQKGWTIEAVEPDQTQFEGLTNIHTHGLTKLGLKDLQIVAQLHPQMATQIIAAIAQKMYASKVIYKDGDIIADLHPDLKLKVIAMQNEGEEVLRIILPDESGNLEYKDQVYPYNKQYMAFE